jgi:NADPH:quinone reductase-like Zn-dependent oxidoreductase
MPTMKAVSQDRFGEPGLLRVTDVPRPEPLPTEVLVRVHAAGINPIDWKSRAGSGLPGIGAPPLTVGWDVSGVVEEVGFGVHTLRVGDEVYGMPWFPRPASAYAQYVTAPARQLALKPTTMSHEIAAALPLAALTAWQCLTDAAHVTAGQRVLIHGAAGGVGHLAVQFAKHLGAHVIGTARADDHAWLRSLGADEVVDYTRTRFENDVRDVDVVLDTVGDGIDRTSTRSLDTLRPGGMIIPIPGPSPELMQQAQQSGMRVTGFLVEPDGASLRAIAELVDAGAIAVRIGKTFALADAAEAHRLGEKGHTQGKLVLRVAA